MVPKTAITTTATTTPTKAGPFDHLTLVGFDGVNDEERRIVQVLTVALMRRIDVTGELSIRFSKIGKTPWKKSGGCRFNRMSIPGEESINVTYQWHGSLEVTANIETGDRTLEIMSSIRDLGINGQTLPQKALAGQIRAIEQEVEKLQASRIVQMSDTVTVAPAGEAKEPVVETPIFGMTLSCFIVYLRDILTMIQHESGISITNLVEVSGLTPNDWNPPRGQTLEELFEWLRNYGCIYAAGGLHPHKLNAVTLRCLIEYRMEKGVFPEMPSATALPAVKEATPATGVLEPRQKRRYTKRQPKKVVVPVVEKVQKPRRRSLCQVMEEFDSYFVVPLMQQLEQKFHKCLSLVSTNLGKAKKVFAQIEKLEAKLAVMRSQRDRFEKLMQEIV